VLDSPANNAMCHFINLALFLIGESEWQSAQTASVEAELYRASPIENYDTCAIRAQTEHGAKVLVLMTHACATRVEPVVRIEGTRGEMLWQEGEAVIRSNDREERFESANREGVIEKLSAYLRGQQIDGVVATLEMARAQTVLVNAASEASAITPIPPGEITTVQANTWADDYDTVQAVTGIERLVLQCAHEGKMFNESRLVPWSRPPGRIDTRGYREFRGPKH
jgi:predicted dehydrogenase